MSIGETFIDPAPLKPDMTPTHGHLQNEIHLQKYNEQSIQNCIRTGIKDAKSRSRSKTGRDRCSIFFGTPSPSVVVVEPSQNHIKIQMMLARQDQFDGKTDCL